MAGRKRNPAGGAGRGAHPIMTRENVHPLQAAAILKEVSLTEVAEKTGIHRTNLQKFVSGSYPMTDATAQKLSKFFRLPQSYFLEGGITLRADYE